MRAEKGEKGKARSARGIGLARPAETFYASRGSFSSSYMVSNYPTKPLDAAFQDLVTIIIQDEKTLKYLNE